MDISTACFSLVFGSACATGILMDIIYRRRIRRLLAEKDNLACICVRYKREIEELRKVK